MGGTLTTYHFSTVADPVEREGPLPADPTLLSQQEEGRFLPPLATAQPMRDRYSLASEKPLYLELPVYSNRLFAYSSPATFPFPYKREFVSHPSFSRLVYGFAEVIRFSGGLV